MRETTLQTPRSVKKEVEDPTPEQVDVPEGGCDPAGDPCWSSLFPKDCTP